MKIIKSSDESWQEKQGYSKKIFLDRSEDKRIVVQEIKIKPGETAKSHFHKIQTEVFYFLNSNGYWIVNGERIEPKVGEVLVIEPGDHHEVVNNTSNDYSYLAFKFDTTTAEDIFWD